MALVCWELSMILHFKRCRVAAAVEEGIWLRRNGTWARYKLREVLAPVPSLHSPLPPPMLLTPYQHTQEAIEL